MTDQLPRHDILVGLHVTDDPMYTEYRAGMTPILERYGGSFRYDFKIAETLKSETEDEIDRVFIISFPDEQSKETFFSNEEYLEVKRIHFTPSVGSVTILAEYEA